MWARNRIVKLMRKYMCFDSFFWSVIGENAVMSGIRMQFVSAQVGMQLFVYWFYGKKLGQSAIGIWLQHSKPHRMEHL